MTVMSPATISPTTLPLDWIDFSPWKSEASLPIAYESTLSGVIPPKCQSSPYQNLYGQLPGMDGIESVSTAQKDAALRSIYCALGGQRNTQQKDNDPHIAISEYAGLGPMALLYAIYARITDANGKLHLSLVRGFEQVHQAETRLEEEKLNLYEQQVKKFFEAQEKARYGEIANIAFDWIVGAAEIAIGALQFAAGWATGNPLKIASGVALLTAGLIGWSKGALEVAALIEKDEQLKNTARQLGDAETFLNLAGLTIDGMGAVYAGLQSWKGIGQAARAGIEGMSSEAKLAIQSGVREITGAAAEVMDSAAEAVSQSIFNDLKAQGWKGITQQQIATRVERILAEGCLDFGQLVTKLQYQLGKSALPSRVLELISSSIQHLYIITSLVNQILQVLRNVVSGVVGLEVSKSEAQAKKLEAQGEWLKTLISVQRERMEWLLKRLKDQSTRIVNDQAALLQESRMLSQGRLRMINVLTQAV